MTRFCEFFLFLDSGRLEKMMDAKVIVEVEAKVV